MTRISENLPNIFWEPAPRGSTVELRIRVHPTGNGEVIAKQVELSNAQMIVAAVAAHDELVATLRWVRANYAAGNTSEINARIDAALSKAEA